MPWWRVIRAGGEKTSGHFHSSLWTKLLHTAHYTLHTYTLYSAQYTLTHLHTYTLTHNTLYTLHTVPATSSTAKPLEQTSSLYLLSTLQWIATYIKSDINEKVSQTFKNFAIFIVIIVIMKALESFIYERRPSDSFPPEPQSYLELDLNCSSS